MDFLKDSLQGLGATDYVPLMEVVAIRNGFIREVHPIDDRPLAVQELSDLSLQLSFPDLSVRIGDRDPVYSGDLHESVAFAFCRSVVVGGLNRGHLDVVEPMFISR